MKNRIIVLKPYCVRVSAIVTTEVPIYAESEEDAILQVQEICDRTNLIRFTEDDLDDISADEAFEIPPFCSNGVRRCAAENDE